MTALCDTHAVQRGTRHFARDAIARLRSEVQTTGLTQLSGPFETQCKLAERQALAPEQRLTAIGHSPSVVALLERQVALLRS